MLPFAFACGSFMRSKALASTSFSRRESNSSCSAMTLPALSVCTSKHARARSKRFAQGLHEGKAAGLFAQVFVFPDSVPFDLLCKSSSNFVFSLNERNNSGYFNTSILEFARASTVFTGFSLDENEKPSKCKRRWTVG
jgi:hypothetical protein